MSENRESQPERFSKMKPAFLTHSLPLSFRQRNLSTSARRAPFRICQSRRSIVCSEGPLDKLRDAVEVAYNELEPSQQILVQVMYITCVVSIMLSISANLVRLYQTALYLELMKW